MPKGRNVLKFCQFASFFSSFFCMNDTLHCVWQYRNNLCLDITTTMRWKFGLDVFIQQTFSVNLLTGMIKFRKELSASTNSAVSLMDVVDHIAKFDSCAALFRGCVDRTSQQFWFRGGADTADELLLVTPQIKKFVADHVSNHTVEDLFNLFKYMNENNFKSNIIAVSEENNHVYDWGFVLWDSFVCKCLTDHCFAYSSFFNCFRSWLLCLFTFSLANGFLCGSSLSFSGSLSGSSFLFSRSLMIRIVNNNCTDDRCEQVRAKK